MSLVVEMLTTDDRGPAFLRGHRQENSIGTGLIFNKTFYSISLKCFKNVKSYSESYSKIYTQ